ncbi:hypothetical protein JX266_009459 [Neoarthrinium moseri]|uniref:uncharacterized protein n=1 Tax=Neoarthrinium moseri TaxID=1658444 RepID=UPI001FDC8D56|nr:uncharacterized protein JN550_010445 [Neoarthrinium moseri]KAI1844365.1 hypothetical protein JX266_009459 [Neoarthrinium moseri]KAI1862142.1 hypothetical protein JN550_010445 [Neoarthrinium moseri]
MPGSEFRSHNSSRRPQQPTTYHQQRQNNGNNWPAQRTQTQVAQTGGQARPVRNLPAMPVKHTNVTKPQMGYVSIPEPMSAEVQRVKSTRAHKPAPIKVQQATNVHRPQIVHHQPVFPQMAQIAQVVQPVRRDSNGISECGSADGDSPGWRNHAVSPRAVSPLHETYQYQSWPMAR